MTHRYLSRSLHCLLILAGLAIGIAVTSCNAKDDTPKSDNYVSTESVAITNFSLAADIRIMKNLDSVYFSIDLEHGVVFNADSLPKGTKITKLVPKISYPSSVTSAEIEMTGGTHREGTVNYIKHSTDTIDFTGDVKLTLGAGDNITKTYTLKVNVHQADPDTIYWDSLASMSLPSRMANPAAQKAVAYGNDVACLIQESDGSYTLSTTSDIFEGNWTKNQVEFGCNPDVRSFTAGRDGAFFIVDKESGSLLTSADALSWQTADTGWSGIIGLYGDVLIGLSTQTSPSVMKSWPSGELPETVLPEGFPLTGYSDPIEFTNRWTPDPTIVIFGGYPLSASGRSPSWAFDGTQWADIADTALPALAGLTVVPYYSYLNSATNGLLREFEVYLAFGGYDRELNTNNTVYISYDHGINWQRAQQYMQMPEGIWTGIDADALALGTSMQSNLSNRWKAQSGRRKLPFVIDGDLVKWECPYIFIFGGYPDYGYSGMNSSIRSGVLQRLTFEPLF